MVVEIVTMPEDTTKKVNELVLLSLSLSRRSLLRNCIVLAGIQYLSSTTLHVLPNACPYVCYLIGVAIGRNFH